MAGAYRIDICLFHQPQVGKHLFTRNRVAGNGVTVVTVHTLQLNRRAVHIKHRILCLDFPHTHTLGNGFALRL